MKHIKTWNERCEDHPDHNGIVTHEMIKARMQEEIDELRSERDWYEAKIQTYKNFAAIAEASGQADEQRLMRRKWFGGRDTGHLSFVDAVNLTMEKLHMELEHIGDANKMVCRKWVGLTDEEIEYLDMETSGTVFDFVHAIEAKLKEKNS